MSGYVDFIRHKFISLLLSLSFFLLHRSITRPSVPPLSKKPLRSPDFTRRVNRILYLGFAACRPANCFFRVCIGEPVERRRGKRRGPPPSCTISYPIPRREQGDDEFGRYENLGRPLGQERAGQSRTAFELRPCTGCFDKRDPLLSSNNYCVETSQRSLSLSLSLLSRSFPFLFVLTRVNLKSSMTMKPMKPPTLTCSYFRLVLSEHPVHCVVRAAQSWPREINVS